MANLAAVIHAEKAPLEVEEVEKYPPGPNELLIKNEVIAFNPIEAKVARLSLFPLKYPNILGLSYGGTVEAVGEGAPFKIGDKVAVRNSGVTVGNKNGSFQRYVIAASFNAVKVPEGVDVAVMANVIGNFSTVVGLVRAAGLNSPKDPSSVGKVLVYGGTSSVGSQAVQYLSQAGYTVVTTTSPKHQEFVAKLGAARIVDHTSGNLASDLIANGPYDVVIDSISIASTVATLAQVLKAQGGGKVYALLPAFAPETLPEGISRIFESWPVVFAEKENRELAEWAYGTYLPEGFAKGKIIALQNQKVDGGLNGVDEALSLMLQGVSGVRLIADPWE